MNEMTTREAIKTYDIGANLLYRWITRGEIATRKDSNGKWLIRKDSVEKRNRVRLARRRENP